MVNTRAKMHNVNSNIRKYLKAKGFTDLYLFPHMRHMKDYHVGGSGFDAIGWKENVFSYPDKQCYLFQFKTNNPCPKKILVEYAKVAKKYNAVLCWVSFFNKSKRSKAHPHEIEMWEINSREVKQ